MWISEVLDGEDVLLKVGQRSFASGLQSGGVVHSLGQSGSRVAEITPIDAAWVGGFAKHVQSKAYAAMCGAAT
eukprot:14799170-Alexandrium_andersonii.AAC.1